MLITYGFHVFSNLILILYFVNLYLHFSIFARGRPFEKNLIHTVETVVIEWSHQIHSLLQKNSARFLLEGKQPGPLVEIDFWKDRVLDLESVIEQLYDEKAQKMTRLLERTKSSYYTALQNMVIFQEKGSVDNCLWKDTIHVVKEQ